MQQYSLVALLAPLLLGCEPHLVSVSADHVGCVSAGIQVPDYESAGMNGASWVAERLELLTLRPRGARSLPFVLVPRREAFP